MDELDYHREDQLQHFDKVQEETKSRLQEKQLNRNFNNKRQISILIVALAGIIISTVYGIRDGFFEYTKPRGIPHGPFLLVEILIVFFAIRNLLRSK